MRWWGGVFAAGLMSWAFIGCASDKTVNLTYQVSTQQINPDLIIVITSDLSFSTWDQNVNFRAESGEFLSFFSGNEEALKGCAADLGYVERKSNFPVASPDSNPKAKCLELASAYRNIFGDSGVQTVGSDALSTRAVTFPNRSSGYAFILFFWGSTKASSAYGSSNNPADYRCFQLFSFEIEGQKLIEYTAATNTRTPRESTSVNLDSIPSANQTNPLCYNY